MNYMTREESWRTEKESGWGTKVLHNGKPTPEKGPDRIACSNTKNHSFHTLILQSKYDAKKLYKIINNMTGGKTLNPMPSNKTGEELANKFDNYFLDKIEKIRSKLTAIKPYTPKKYDTPALQRIHYTYWRSTIQGVNGHAY